jgi:hypothetical protein
MKRWSQNANNKEECAFVIKETEILIGLGNQGVSQVKIVPAI